MFDIMQIRTDVQEHIFDIHGGKNMYSTAKVTRMNDSQYRIYKRSLKRVREARRKFVRIMLGLCLMMMLSVSLGVIHSNAHGADIEGDYKYYTTIKLDKGDTLWELANTYGANEYYKNNKAYINEVININNLKSATDIRAGQIIIIPYYSSEFIY